MLTSIRQGTKSWLLYLIVGIIVLSFAFLGIGDYLSGSYNQDLIKVGKVTVSLNEYRNAYESQRRRLQQELGDEYEQRVSEADLVNLVRLNLTNNALWQNKIAEFNLDVNPSHLQNMIRNFEAFQTNGKFDYQKYTSFLNRSGISPATFESEQNTNVMISQARSPFYFSQFVSDYEYSSFLDIVFQERNLSVLEFDRSYYVSQITPNEQEISEFYNANLLKYLEPEKVSVNYLVFNQDSFRNELNLTEEDFSQYYQDTIDNYLNEEKRQARHILFEIDDNASDLEIQDIMQKIDDAINSINNGEEFANVAMKFSDDIATKDNGGDLGLLTKGDLDSELESVLWELEPNTLSQPVKTKFGYHLVEVTKITERTARPYIEVKEQIVESLTNERLGLLISDKLERATNLAFENPESLEPIAEELDVPVLTSALFDAFGNVDGNELETLKLIKSESFLESAFSNEVKVEGFNSDIVAIDDETFAIIRNKKVKPEVQLELETVKEVVIQDIKEEQANLELTNDANYWIEVIISGLMTVEKISKENKEKVLLKDYGLLNIFTAQEAFRNPQKVEIAFGMAKPTVEGAKTFQLGYIDDIPFIFKLNSIRYPTKAELNKSENYKNLQQELRENLLSALRVSALENAQQFYLGKYDVREIISLDETN